METISINRVMARSFINTLYYAMFVDGLSLLKLDPMGALRFRMLSDAQLSVLYSLAAYVTDHNEVMEEYDLVLTMLKDKLPDSAGASALTEGRKALTELLISAKSH